MPPIRKIQLDKAAWLWAETVDPNQVTEDNIKTAYRINVPKCKIGTCRRNCRGNPYCVSGLGESKWLNQNAEDSEEEDADLQVRPPDTFVGLKNLGATCYVNSLVQLWFHNLAFRKAIFSWNPLEDPMELAKLEHENPLKAPHTVVGHLQLLFAQMQFSKQKSLDPLAFIKALDLEPSMQQDAQEFSKLFITLLEDSLNQQSDPKLQNLIIDHFRGEYSYITRCSKCLNCSVSPSMFYELELNIKGHKTLHDCISEYLKEEKLDGANMYSCSVCNEKQEAARAISLHKLPRVLNLQLMRFIYDRQKGHKKKINSSIQFPDVLDMSEYMATSEAEKKPLLYNLTAVLIHKGPSAYSGHYVAHICDQVSGIWYKFNDELVEKMEGNKLKLGSEEEQEDGTKKPKQARLGKGILQSSNAYMLVYTAVSDRGAVQPVTEADLQPELLQQVYQCNETFDGLLVETKEARKNKKVNGRAQKAEMASLLEKIPVSEEAGPTDWEVLSVKWLTYWLDNTELETRPVDNQHLLCPHHRLHPDSVSHAKYISTDPGKFIYEKCGGGPRLVAQDALCRDCVVAKCRGIRFRAKLTEDVKEISTTLKQKDDLSDNSFWVGKRSLKDWRRKALRMFEEREGDSGGKEVSEMRDMEDCPSPSSDNEVAPPQPPPPNFRSQQEDALPDSSADCVKPTKKKCRMSEVCVEREEGGIGSVSGQLDSIESLIHQIRSHLGEIKNEHPTNCESLSELKDLFKKWQFLGSSLSKLCDTNNLSVSETGPVVSSTSCARSEGSSSENSAILPVNNINGTCYNGDGDNKGRKRKFENIGEKDGGGNSGDETKNKSDDEEEECEDFNEDMICQHGNMILEESLRRLVSETIWTKLKGYFPEAREFPVGLEPCEHCKSLASQDQATMDLRREQATYQKELLQSLFLGRNRPRLSVATCHVVSVPEFLRPWRRFVRESGREPPLFSLRNSTLVCLHGLLLFNPASEEDANLFAPVTDEEWHNLISIFSCDTEITVTYGEQDKEVIATSPELCSECVLARMASKQEALLQYEKAKVYIRPVSNSKREEIPEANSATSIETNGGAGKRPPNKMATDCSSEAAIRRSTRHRRARGEREILVSCHETLRDLKLKILEVLRVAPFDQHLSTEDGRDLTDATATLASLNILPGTVLLLRVDEPPEDSSLPMDDYIRTSEPEAGFKGTVLLR